MNCCSRMGNEGILFLICFNHYDIEVLFRSIFFLYPKKKKKGKRDSYRKHLLQQKTEDDYTYTSYNGYKPSKSLSSFPNVNSIFTGSILSFDSIKSKQEPLKNGAW